MASPSSRSTSEAKLSAQTTARIPLATVVIAVALLALPPGHGRAQCPEAQFDTPIRIATQAVVRSIVAVDVNGDRQRDLVLSGAVPGAVSVLLSIHAATAQFSAPANLEVGRDPSGLTAIDLNDDGATDLLVAVSGENRIAVLLNDGRGTFRLSTTLAVGVGPTAVAAGDLNRDGRLDLAVANTGSSEVSVSFGNESGDWTRAASFPVGRAPRSIVIGDLQHDGVPDLATAASEINMISTLKGDGAGNFGDVVNFPALVLPVAMIPYDMNGDGENELVLANQGSDNITIATANADGALETLSYAAWLGPADLGIADFNRDKLADVAVTNRDDAAASILLGKKEGGFADPQQIALKTTPGALAVADLNGDGAADLTIATTSDLVVLLNSCAPLRLPLALWVAAGTAAYILVALFLARRYPHAPAAH